MEIPRSQGYWKTYWSVYVNRLKTPRATQMVRSTISLLSLVLLEDSRITEKHVVGVACSYRCSLYLLLMFFPISVPRVKGSLVSFLPQGKGSISWCSLDRMNLGCLEVSLCTRSLHAQIPISVLAREGTWEAPFLLLFPQPPP